MALDILKTQIFVGTVEIGRTRRVVARSVNERVHVTEWHISSIVP